jgi:hypothetical protein
VAALTNSHESAAFLFLPPSGFSRLGATDARNKSIDIYTWPFKSQKDAYSHIILSDLTAYQEDDVQQMVEALCYTPESRAFDSQ